MSRTARQRERRRRQLEEKYGPLLTYEERGPLIDAGHRVFDPLWRSGLVTRGQLYRLLAEELNIRRGAAHFSNMHPAHLREVPSALENIQIELHERLRR